MADDDYKGDVMADKIKTAAPEPSFLDSVYDRLFSNTIFPETSEQAANLDAMRIMEGAEDSPILNPEPFGDKPLQSMFLPLMPDWVQGAFELTDIGDAAYLEQAVSEGDPEKIAEASFYNSIPVLSFGIGKYLKGIGKADDAYDIMKRAEKLTKERALKKIGPAVEIDISKTAEDLYKQFLKGKIK